MNPRTPFDSSDLDGFRLEIGPDTYYITVQDQHQAVSLEEKGLRRPIEISTTRASTVYFAVPHNDHLAPVCLRLSPFTLGQVPGQIFYCIYFWYTKWCHLDPGLDKITKGVQRVYRVYFAGGPCDFNDANCQPLPSIDVEEGTPCHARAQLAFDRLIRQHQPLEKWEYDEVSTGLKPKRRAAKTRKLKRSSATLPGEDDEPGTASPSPVPDPEEPKQGSVLALCAKISASQSTNDTQPPQVSEPGKALFKKLSDGLIKAGKSEIIAGMICITTDGVELHLPAKTILLENAARTWAAAEELERGAAELSWILRFLSTCMRLVQRKLLQFVPDDQGSEEKKKCRWEHGVLMLNRVVNKLGPMGLRLYDAAAVKNLLLTSCADFSEENRHSIADDAVHRLLEWNEKDGQEETSVKRRHKSEMKQQVSLPGTLRVLFPPRALMTLFQNAIDYAIICQALALPNFIDTQVHSEFITLQDLGGRRGGDDNSPPTIRPRWKRLRPEDVRGSPPLGESDAEVVQPQFDGRSHCADTFTSVSLHRVSSPRASQPRSRPNDQVHPLDHSNANLGPLSTGDEAEGANLETRTFTPINTSQHAGPVASLPTNASAAPSPLQGTFFGLIPSFQPSVRVHPPSSGATLFLNDKQRRPEPTDCRPGSDRSGEPAGADWHADQSPGVTPLCTPAQSQVIASPESPSPMGEVVGEVVGNWLQADSHLALVRTGDGGSSQVHTFNAEDMGEQQVTNSAALGGTQPPSVPAKARSGYGQARKSQSDDDDSDGQFDDQTVEKAAPTRPWKRQRRDESRGPPRDRSPLDRGRRRDNGTGLHPGDPVYVSSPLALQTEGILALPALYGAVEQQLAALISFGSGHYPPDDFVQFRPGEMITGRILYELLHLELKQFSNHALGVPSQRVTKTTADIIIWPENVNSNHWVIAIIDKKQKRFTSYGMTKGKMDECRGAYQEALQLGPLEAVSYPLQDYAGNTCAFRCCDALAAYLGTRSEKIQDPVSLRLFYLRRLLQSRLQPETVSVPTPQPISNEADENESPGAEWHQVQLPGGTRLDTPAKSHAVGSPEDNPPLTGSADSPSVAVSLEIQPAPSQEQNHLPGPNISLPDGPSLPVEHLTYTVDRLGGHGRPLAIDGQNLDVGHALREISSHSFENVTPPSHPHQSWQEGHRLHGNSINPGQPSAPIQNMGLNLLATLAGQENVIRQSDGYSQRDGPNTNPQVGHHEAMHDLGAEVGNGDVPTNSQAGMENHEYDGGFMESLSTFELGFWPDYMEIIPQEQFDFMSNL